MDFIVQVRAGRAWETWAVCPRLEVAERCVALLQAEGESARVKRERRAEGGGD